LGANGDEEQETALPRSDAGWDERAWWAKQLGREPDDLDLPNDPPDVRSSDSLTPDITGALDEVCAIVDELLEDVGRVSRRHALDLHRRPRR
jgi:hypothetical protein